jgi:hypothetical protein
MSPLPISLADLTSPAAIDALVEAGADLLRPSNRSPREVVQNLVAGGQDWQALEAQVVTVHHTRNYGRNKIELDLANDRDTPAAIAATSILQRRLKARLIRHADPHDASQFADREQRQPKRHEFYAKPGVILERRRSKRRS